jgi:hypothetical protein
MTSLQVRLSVATLVLLVSVACGGSSADNPVGPSDSNPAPNTPGITNNTDDFQFNLPNVSNYSTNGGYTWKNTGTTARVTQSSSISSGSGTLTVRDAGGRIVYSKAFSEGGTVTTEAGPAGDWRIEMAPSGVTGTISFRVQKN